MNLPSLPLSIPQISNDEIESIKSSLIGGWVSSSGPDIKIFEESFRKKNKSKFSSSTMNGTSALHLSLVALGIHEGHDVLVPNITFIATINAVLYTGASPFLVDINPKTLCISVSEIENIINNQYKFKLGKLINKETNNVLKCIMPVHILGFPCDMDEINNIAKKYGLAIVEDAAESLGAKYKGKFTGNLGKIGCFSFNGNKIITSGGGGMIVTSSKKINQLCKHLSSTAKTNALTYEHDMVGYNYRMVNILASLGNAQLSKLDSFLNKKRGIHNAYKKLFFNNEYFTLHTDDRTYVEPSYWLNLIKFKKSILKIKSKEELVNFFKTRKIEVRPFWQPLSMMKHLKSVQRGNLNHSLKVWNSSIMVPSCISIDEEQLFRVKDTFMELLS